MGLRQKLDEKIRKKEQEIQSLETSIREARVYLQAMQDMLKLIPRDDSTKDGAETDLLKPGSAVFRAMQAIKEAGKPLHISAILRAMDVPDEKKHRVSLGGSLARYVRDGQIFTRSAPNTFGLVAMSQGGDEPPEDFGVIDHK